MFGCYIHVADRSFTATCTHSLAGVPKLNQSAAKRFMRGALWEEGNRQWSWNVYGYISQSHSQAPFPSLILRLLTPTSSILYKNSSSAAYLNQIVFKLNVVGLTT